VHEVTVVHIEQVRTGGNFDNCHTARLQHTMDFGKPADILLDVLQDVQDHDRI
jgi:hypothetical protein